MTAPTATTALLTLSHGSRHPEAAANVMALTHAAGELAGAPATAAHLEFNDPPLDEAARSLAAQGVREAVVVPLLFTEGYHQRIDVPAALAQASAASGVRLHQARGLGTGEDMARLLAKRVPEGTDTVVLYSVGSSDERANADVADLARRVGELTGCTAKVAYATRGEREPVGSDGNQEVVVPLFVSPGLLLDRLDEDAGHRGGESRQVLPPLGEALAGIVSHRYAEVAHA
ncbi:sirohydrochlorin chelatase [Corynebacterium sp. c25Ua_47]|uniref:sirohydrochlorin chelatase n=1 Tax=Corynebacterium sp. c25Ua_47 TaxID=3032353 RepID=UPI0032630151